MRTWHHPCQIISKQMRLVRKISSDAIIELNGVINQAPIPTPNSQLFQDKPQQWGLRGDPSLWDEMAATLKARTYAEKEQAFAAFLEQTYAQLTGLSLANPNLVYVERFHHGGMSSGSVSPQFWVETALPTLLAR